MFNSPQKADVSGAMGVEIEQKKGTREEKGLSKARNREGSSL